MTDTQTEAETGTIERDRLMSQAYGMAQRRLRDAHKDEFNGFYAEECKARGIEWTPKKSKQEQALDEITKLLSTYPDLAEKLVERLSKGA